MQDLTAKYEVHKTPNDGVLDLSQLDIEIDVPTIDIYPNEQYALLRKHGLGTSDSSIVLGVNPYKTRSDLIAEKARNYLTEEEKAVGDKAAVKKGRDLEPLIITKYSEMIGQRIIKPVDMYRSKSYPWLKFNYDGVIDKTMLEDGKYQYIPSEIKVVTMYGEKHYDRTKAYFRESMGLLNIPDDYSKTNNSIETKAALYGIPPYYYTQLQQEIFGLNAPYGYLTVLFDKTWEIVSYMIWRDDAMLSQLLIEGYKTWEQVLTKTGPGWENTEPFLNQFRKEDGLPPITYLD